MKEGTLRMKAQETPTHTEISAEATLRKEYGNVLSYFEMPYVSNEEGTCRCLSDDELDAAFQMV